MKPRIICYVAGKSGGHIIPALTLAQETVQEHPETKILFFSTDTRLDRSIINNYSCIDFYTTLSLGNFPRKHIIGYPRFMVQFFISLCISMYTLIRYKPEKIISMGGYVSIPVCVAGFLLRIPVEAYELNVVPGAAIKLICKWAQKIFICFPSTQDYFKKKCYHVDYPVRFKERISRDQARGALGLDQNKKTLLVLGGSQGSRALNELMKRYTQSQRENLVILHQTGERDVEAMRAYYQTVAITADVFAYRQNLDIYYAAADIIIARAGAGTLFEIKFFQKRAIIIPLEVATTKHQVDNANAMAQLCPDLFTIIRQCSLEQSPNIFINSL